MLTQNAAKSAKHYLGIAGEDTLENRPFTEHHFKDCPADVSMQIATPKWLVDLFLLIASWCTSCCEHTHGLQEPDCFTVGDLVRAQAGALIPIMERYHVDVYDAGHVHSCKSCIALGYENASLGN